jgi:hypothetical protein
VLQAEKRDFGLLALQSASGSMVAKAQSQRRRNGRLIQTPATMARSNSHSDKAMAWMPDSKVPMQSHGPDQADSDAANP